MQSLTQITKDKILDTLPQLFIESNADEIIRKVEELKIYNWCAYVYCTSDYHSFVIGNKITLTSKTEVAKFLIEQIIKNILTTHRKYNQYILTTIQSWNLLPTITTIDQLADRNYLTKNLKIDDTTDYVFDLDPYRLIFSCHQSFIRSQLELLLEQPKE